MAPTPSILCPVDLSDHSRAVVRHAGAVAEHFGARLIVCNIKPAHTIDQDLQSLVQEALPTHAASLIECRSIVERRHPASVILRLAHELVPDLIVMGSHGVSGFKKHVFGSTTEAVLKHTEVPVLVVPGIASDLHSVRELHELGSVLAPTDFSELSRRDVHIAAGVAEAIGVPLLLTHVLHCLGEVLEAGAHWRIHHKAAQAELEALRSELKTRAPVELLLLAGHPADEIARVAATQQVGLIIMGLRGAGGVFGPRPGSIAYRVLCLAPTLLVAVPPLLLRGRHPVHATDAARKMPDAVPG
jgi:nucleotide-binding universal stress UspA family protein